MIETIMSRPMSVFSRQYYSEVILSILNVKDGATEKRLADYMSCHMDLIVRMVTNEKVKGRALTNPLETLSLIVNNGGKEVKEEYRRAAPEIFTESVLDAGDFEPSYM